MNNENRTPIYIAGFPKSGTTFTTRLIGDALNSPTGGSIPGQDHKEPASEGHDRPGKYVIRKGHFKILDGDPGTKSAVPRAHEIYIPKLSGGERVIFLVRDPRDICVSGSFYFNVPMKQYLNDLIHGTGKCRFFGGWREYVEKWIYTNTNYYQITTVRYEDLVRQPYLTMTRILEVIEGEVKDENRLAEAIKRNRFDAMKKRVEREGDTMPLGMLQNKRLVRKGIVGDWRNHFTDEMNDLSWQHFGNIMKLLGYTR